MRKLISFVHISLDGFIAGPNGEMNWIKIDDDIFRHVEKRITQTDTALYGRNTFEMMEGYWPTAADKPNPSKHDIEHSKWYKDARKVVLSKTLKAADFSNTEIISENLEEKILRLKHSGENEILVFGSPSATHTLQQLDLIDGYWLFVNPIILGRGIPLFSDIRENTRLHLESTSTFNNGVIELDYSVINGDAVSN